MEVDWGKYIAFDLETKGLYGELIVAGFKFFNTQKYIFKTTKEETLLTLKDFIDTGHVIVGHNLYYDFSVLDWFPERTQFEDTYLLAKSIRDILSNNQSFGLYDLVTRYNLYTYPVNKKTFVKKIENRTVEEVKEYLKCDLVAIELLFKFLCEERKGSKGNKAYQLDKAFLPILWKIQKTGVPIDKDLLTEIYNNYKIQLGLLYQSIYTQYRINPRSPLQIRDRFKLPDAQTETLYRYLQEKPELKQIIDFKKVEKIYEFCKKYLEACKNGRIYGHYDVCGSKTGRLACSRENLLQIPREMRKCFRSKEKKILLFDFSQIELRLAGEMWREPNFIMHFTQDLDLHKATASYVFKVPLNEVTPEQRQIAKSLNFGLIYGITKEGMASVLASYGFMLSLEEVGELMISWRKLNKQIALLHKDVYNTIKTHGSIVVSTKLGREIVTSSLNIALNFPIQGTGAELLKLTLGFFNKECPDARIINIIHDEIQIEGTEEELIYYAQKLNTSLQKAWAYLFPNYVIPVKAEWKITDSLQKD